ncbi:hypothetical protein AB2N08_01045 [Massilia aurea]|uniref:hypothetical protein n=1 Tax=Massilia aurea TaxID=373040 RepID=UPI003462F033
MSNEALYRESAVNKIEHLAARFSQSGSKRIMCSRDPDVASMEEDLVDLIPADFDGVKRFFLPIAPVLPKGGTGRYSAYYAQLAPNTVVPMTANESEHYALKVVLIGSIRYDNRWLTAGDWLWIPAGESYAFTCGNFGALLLTTLPYCETDERYESVFGKVDEAEAFVKNGTGGRATSCNGAITKSAMKQLRGISEHVAEQVDGVDHWFLPFAPLMPSNESKDGRYFAWISTLTPNTVIPSHSHTMEKLGDMKVVISGSIFHDDEELTAGDWLWIPAGEKYTFTVGSKGATTISMWPWN